ncbi:U-scoloptoxin(16)-Ssd1a [Anopheles bellator]|uniref:U-scoloptoxin(16)-Ssd1a n=1 Tax=Anopheles bellator TaxID=139047 RepID=UPI002649E8CC|nr:U-scoloptoxin(16)-Ssd1a [Anopheles bellator]
MKSSVAQKYLTVAIALATVLSTEAYVYINPDAKSPDQDGQCYDSETQITFPVGESRQRPERCESMSCDDRYSLSVAGCGVVMAGPGVVVTKTDYSKPYPDCCPQLVMSEENLV